MRTQAASELLAAADAEVELSRQRLHDTREQIVKPLRERAERNNFAELIAASLTQGQGYRRGEPG